MNAKMVASILKCQQRYKVAGTKIPLAHVTKIEESKKSKKGFQPFFTGDQYVYKISSIAACSSSLCLSINLRICMVLFRPS